MFKNKYFVFFSLSTTVFSPSRGYPRSKNSKKAFGMDIPGKPRPTSPVDGKAIIQNTFVLKIKVPFPCFVK